LYPLFSYRFGGLTNETGDPIGYLLGEQSTDYARITREAEMEDLVFHGSVQPTYFGALNNQFVYRGVRLGINMSYRFDYYFRRPTVLYSNLQSSNSLHTDYYRRWLEPGDEAQTSVPSFVYPFNAQRERFYEYSTATIEKGDHI